MRKKLKERLGTIGRYTGIVKEFSDKCPIDGKKSVILVNVTDSLGEEITDHIWIPTGGSNRLCRSDLKIGYILSFDARVNQYTKIIPQGLSYTTKTDYGLTGITNIEINGQKFIPLANLQPRIEGECIYCDAPISKNGKIACTTCVKDTPDQKWQRWNNRNSRSKGNNLPTPEET